MFWKKKPKYPTTQITDSNFNELVGKPEVPVLLDFYADWCGPCKILEPFIDELAEEYEGRALVAKVNTEANPRLSQHFKIKSIPTIMFVNKGQIVERFQGLIPKPNLEEILDEYIAENAGA
ncbi:MAG: thioredoxin [Bacteroidota bacterium]